MFGCLRASWEFKSVNMMCLFCKSNRQHPVIKSLILIGWRRWALLSSCSITSALSSCLHQLWDLAQGKTITEFKSHTAAVNIVQFHPNEYLLASGSSDRYVAAGRALADAAARSWRSDSRVGSAFVTICGSFSFSVSWSSEAARGRPLSVPPRFYFGAEFDGFLNVTFLLVWNSFFSHTCPVSSTFPLRCH